MSVYCIFLFFLDPRALVFQAMARDIKLNMFQYTVKQLQKIYAKHKAMLDGLNVLEADTETTAETASS